MRYSETMVCGCDEHFFLSQKKADQIITLDIEKLLEKYIGQLFSKGKIDKATKTELFKSLYQPLKEAVKEGFGQTKIEYGTPNLEFLKQLQVNTAVFSMFKSHDLVKQTAALLKDESGNLRTKENFKSEALKLDSTYRKDYLDTEYDTAVRSARMASIWAKALSSKHLYPNFEYIPSRAAHPRLAHEKYYGIVLPIEDPFWNTHMPPNGWRCQCSVQQSDQEVSDLPHDLPTPEEGFRNNPGKTGQIFDLKKGYADSVPESEKPRLIKEATKFVNSDLAQEASYETIYKSKRGGIVETHPLSYDNTDFNEVLKVARSLANMGEKVKILPDIQNKNLREQLLIKGAKDNKNPDFLINDQYVADLKIVTINRMAAIKDAIGRCHQQCNNLVLMIDPENDISSEDLQRAVKGKLSHDGYKDFEKVWISYRGNWSQMTREEIVKKGIWNVY